MRDPARRLRRNLILLSAFVCLLTTGILGSGTAMFGFELDPASLGVFEYLLLGLLAYWSLSFLFYAVFDLQAWGTRGGPRGFFGFLLAPFLLVLELFFPLAAAALAALALPSLGVPKVQEVVQGIRDDGIVERAETNASAAMARADLALTPEAAEGILADALLAARMDARSLSDASLMADSEGMLRSRMHQVHLDGIVGGAELAAFQGDDEAACAFYNEAMFFLLHDEIDDAEQAELMAKFTACVEALTPPPAIEAPASPAAGSQDMSADEVAVAARPAAR